MLCRVVAVAQVAVYEQAFSGNEQRRHRKCRCGNNDSGRYSCSRRQVLSALLPETVEVVDWSGEPLS